MTNTERAPKASQPSGMLGEPAQDADSLPSGSVAHARLSGDPAEVTHAIETPPSALPLGVAPALKWHQLRRDPKHGKLAGICAGIAEQTGLDPLLVRAVFVLAGLSAGLGVVVYAAGWLLLPAIGAARPLGVKLAEQAGLPSVAHLNRRTSRLLMLLGVGLTLVILLAIRILRSGRPLISVGMDPLLVLLGCYLYARWSLQGAGMLRHLAKASRPVPYDPRLTSPDPVAEPAAGGQSAPAKPAQHLPPSWPSAAALARRIPDPVAGMPPHPLSWSYPVHEVASRSFARRQRRAVLAADQPKPPVRRAGPWLRIGMYVLLVTGTLSALVSLLAWSGSGWQHWFIPLLLICLGAAGLVVSSTSKPTMRGTHHE